MSHLIPQQLLLTFKSSVNIVYDSQNWILYVIFHSNHKSIFEVRGATPTRTMKSICVYFWPQRLQCNLIHPFIRNPYKSPSGSPTEYDYKQQYFRWGNVAENPPKIHCNPSNVLDYICTFCVIYNYSNLSIGCRHTETPYSCWCI